MIFLVTYIALVLFFDQYQCATWTGYATTSSSALTIDNLIGYNTITSVAGVVTTATDKVLLIASLNVQSTSTLYAINLDFFRGSTDIAGFLKDFQYVDPRESTEYQSGTLVHLDSPGAATTSYSVRGASQGILSSGSQTRQLIALVIPNAFTTAKTQSSSTLTISSTTYTSINIDTTVTTATSNDKVLVLANVNFNPTGLSNGKFTLFRGGVQVNSYAMQLVGGTSSANRVGTFFYLDSPEVAGSVTYSVRAAKASAGDANFELCDSGRDISVATAIVIPDEMVESETMSSAVTISASSWTSIDLDVTIKPQLDSDKVLITVNVNFYPGASTSIGAFTLFRGGTNLGDATNGMQLMKTPTAGEAAAATFAFLDSPGAGSTSLTYSVMVRAISDSFTVGQFGQTSQIVAFVSNAWTAPPTAFPTEIPTLNPTAVPTSVPTADPTVAPTCIPSAVPSAKPTVSPTASPTAHPSAIPTMNPTCAPTASPSCLPTASPSVNPTAAPTSPPSANPSAGPTVLPTASPTAAPTPSPSASPTASPSNNPTFLPTAAPSQLPTNLPTATPTTTTPTANPTFTPSSAPTVSPTCPPSAIPTMAPTAIPSQAPTLLPTAAPTAAPTASPSADPSLVPTSMPTVMPTAQPSCNPTQAPTLLPTEAPTASPSETPSALPTETPTELPSQVPSALPSALPSSDPTAAPTADPTAVPSAVPSAIPSAVPSADPSAAPTIVPTADPTQLPTVSPSAMPTLSPSVAPTVVPSAEPSAVPSTIPTTDPTAQPTAAPTVIPSAVPSADPSASPTRSPTAEPSSSPTVEPSVRPTSDPSAVPTAVPSALPSVGPTTNPSMSPTQRPSAKPSAAPTVCPSAGPSARPSRNPTAAPSAKPSALPSCAPSVSPSAAPTQDPTASPSVIPSTGPTAAPTDAPSAAPIAAPTRAPSAAPSRKPSVAPSAAPSLAAGATAVPTAPTHAPSVLPAPDIGSISASSDVSDPRHAVNIAVHVLGAERAIVHCAAFSQGSGDLRQPRTVDDVLLQRSSAVSAAGVAVMSLPGLVAATEYAVYCAVESAEGALSTLPAVLAQSATVTTACCKEITGTFSMSSLYAEDIAVDALSVAADAPPSSAMTLSLTVVDAESGAAVEGAFLSQTSLAFSPDRDSARVTVIGAKVGSFVVQATVSGVSAAEYPTDPIVLGSFSVLSSTVAPAVPQLLSATFSSDGSSVQVKFDAPTNRAGFTNAFTCTRLLSFPGASAATCSWADDSTIAVLPSSGVSVDLLLTIGSTVTLESTSNVRAQCTQPATCSSWTTAPTASVQVAAPQSPAASVVALSMASTLSGCNSLSVDLSASSGSGGRAWKKPEFTVTSTAVDTTAVATLLNAGYSFSPPTQVPSFAFPDDASYTISVKLCNFLGACGTATRSVIVSKGEEMVPSVTIQGTARRTVSRGSALLLMGSAFTQDCSGGKSTSQLTYSWSVSRGGIAQPALVSASADPSKFRLPAFALATLTSYDVKLTVSSLISDKSASAVTNVYVQQSAIVAQVAGGDAQSIAVEGALTLDASSSYDMDVSGKTGAAAGLSFSWTCVQTAPVYSSQCALGMSGDSTETLSVTAQDIPVGTTSRFTVTVFDSSRLSTATVQLTVQSSTAAVVAITSSAQSLVSVNIAERLTLAASVSTQSSCTAQWTTNEPAVDLARALTPASAVIPAGAARAVDLALPANALPVRASLVFSLTCGQSTATVLVTTNGPPLPGTFSVAPPSGQEMSTPFDFVASFWSDPDLPLTYQFGFVTPSTGSVMVAQGRSEASHVTVNLAAGAAATQHSLTCIARIFDSLGAASDAASTVTVLPLASEAQLNAVILLQLVASAGSADATKGVIALGSAAMNKVGCATSTSCAIYHRSECGKVKNVCGACLTGYVGDWGDANSPCIDAVSAALPTAGLTGPGSAGSACAADSDCTGWLQCDASLPAPVCYLPSKRCTDDCSGHGVCAKLNADSRKPVADCMVGDPTCVAVCQCGAGFEGQSCATDASVVQGRLLLRSAFLRSLLAAIIADDVTAETLAATCDALASITQNPYELSEEAVRLVDDISTLVLSKAVAFGSFPYEHATGVLQAIDSAAIASVRLNATSTVTSTAHVMQTVRLFSALMTPQLVAGQGNVVYVEDNFRMNAVRQLRGFDVSLEILSPTTPLEACANASTSSVTVQEDASGRRHLAVSADDREEFSVSVVTTRAASYGAAGTRFNTNPVHAIVSRSKASATRLRFVLVHNEPVEFTSDADAAANVFNSTCANASDFSVSTYTCADSGEVLTHKCFGVPGVMTSHCPVLRPSCGILDIATGAVDTNSTTCEVMTYDAHSTVCSCTIHPSASSGRRLDSTLQQSGVLDAVSVSVYIGSEFKDTFDSSDDLTSLAALKRVLIVILMFSTLWAGGLLMIFGCTWRRALLKKVHAKAESHLEKKMQSAQVSRSPAAVHQYLTDYVIETFPAVFSNKPFLSRVYGEVKRHHRYLTLFTAPEGEAGDKQRILTGVQLLSIQTMLMFLLSMLYDVQSPSDDGSCLSHIDATSCLSRKSVFDTSQSYCQWSGVESDYPCVYQQPHFSFKVVMYVAVIVSILVSIISFPIDRLFELLSAPVADEGKAAAEESTITKLGRRASNVARRASNFAVSAAAAAKAKLNRATVMVGMVTRQLPGTTEAAHALATASMTVIAENSRRALQQRQMLRLRTYHDAGGKADADGLQSDNSSDESSDSDGEIPSAVRGAELTRTIGTGQLLAQVGLEGTLEKLSEEIQCQRRLLKPSEVDEFDTQWGLDPTGEFAQGERSVLPFLPGRRGARDTILAELQFVERETSMRTQKLRLATDTHTGLEILHLFIGDLLGRDTPAAVIFETKAAEDFKHTKVVTRTSQRLAILALVLINAFFVYYAMLTGYRRGISWQRIYLMACIIQFVVEILLFETMECVWINCAIPVLVSGEVRRVCDSITEVVRNLCVDPTGESRIFLNAPDYLFVSTNVAKKFPDLMESILVQAYTTHLPGELARKWQVGSIARSHRHDRAGHVMLLTGMFGAMQYLGTAPFVLHRMFIRFVQPFVLSGLVLLWKGIVSKAAYVFAAVAVIVAGLAIGAYKYYTDREAARRAKAVVPVFVDYQNNGAAAADSGPEIVRIVAAPEDDDLLHQPSPGLGASRKTFSGAQAGPGSACSSSDESKSQRGDPDELASELSSIISGTLSQRQTRVQERSRRAGAVQSSAGSSVVSAGSGRSSHGASSHGLSSVSAPPRGVYAQRLRPSGYTSSDTSSASEPEESPIHIQCALSNSTPSRGSCSDSRSSDSDSTAV